MKRIPREVFSTAKVDNVAQFGYIVCTENEKLVTADFLNHKVNVVDISNPHTVSTSLVVEEKPGCLGLLSHGLVAMTTNSTIIYLLKVTPTLAVAARIQTGRQYTGVAEGPTQHTLIVSSRKTASDPARVDVITIGGDVVKTVVDGTTLKKLWEPRHLCVVDGFVLLSAYEKDAVYKVDLTTGRLVDTLTHSGMKAPRQTCVDREGNIYVVAYGSSSVLVRSSKGRWRLLVGPLYVKGERCRPSGLCVTRSASLVVIWD